MVDQNRRRELDEALELLHFAFRAVVANPDRILARRGLSRVHHRILYFVCRSPGTSLNRLLRTLGVSKQALNAPLRTLVQEKLITISYSPEDRRVKQLELTARGRELEDALSGDQRRRFAAAFERLGKSKEAAWREVMRALAEKEFDVPGPHRRYR